MITSTDALVTDDGLRLYVETAGPVDAPVTVLLAHGWTCSTRSWHHQLAELPRMLGGAARVVAYDHRGHGRSEAAPIGTTTIPQLARDTAAVLSCVAPSGPVVYAGHSMGGMTALALDPELVRSRLAGLVLVSTSAGQVTSRPFGLPSRFDRAAALLVPPLVTAAGRRSDRRARRHALRATSSSSPSFARSAVRSGSGGWNGSGASGGSGGSGNEHELTVPRVQRPVLRRVAFGVRPDPAEVDILAADVARTPGSSLSGFFAAIAEHDRFDGLERFAGIPVEVMHGTRDRLIGPRHANRLAQAVPGARLWMYPGAGHMLMQERPRDVTHRIAALVRKTL